MTDALIELGRKLLESRSGLRWPEERIQVQYTGTRGERLLQQAADFLHLLEQHAGSLTAPSWRGLDYGVGWGRMASLMTHFGQPDQLDCVDAWDKSLALARACGLQNRFKQVPPQLRSTDLGEEIYDFAYAYSIFTHLPGSHIVNNAAKIAASLKPGGIFLFTVREPKFVEFLIKNGKHQPQVDNLEANGYWFGNAQSADYGDTIVSEEWLHRELGTIGRLRRIGPMKHESTQVAMLLAK